MAWKAPPPDLRELARRRLDGRAGVSSEEWAKAVEDARWQGFRLLCFPGLIVEIRDYSLLAEGEP